MIAYLMLKDNAVQHGLRLICSPGALLNWLNNALIHPINQNPSSTNRRSSMDAVEDCLLESMIFIELSLFTSF